MTTCAVIVTYGNRADLCIKVSREALFQGLHRIIIVNNGSVEESRIRLLQFASENPGISLVSLAQNKGSAEGFATGIRSFLASDGDILLLLDDDNLLCPNTLPQLIAFWEGMQQSDKESRIALCALRRNRPNGILALQSGNSKHILPVENSFMGFHIRLLFKFIAQRLRVRPENDQPMSESLSIPACGYGGLWMHRKLCADIGLPDTSYVLYMDDFAYTKRIPELNGKIILLRDCDILDIEDSYYLPQKKHWLYHSVLNAPKDSIAYYTCRNVVFFSTQYLVSNRVLFHLNKFLFCASISLLALLSNKLRRLRVIRDALRDAKRTGMGLNSRYPL